MPAAPIFDYVFLDADKTGYPDYYEELVPRLLPGGLLLIDTVLLRGRVTNPQDERDSVIAELNKRVMADERVDSVMVLVADGLTFARRRDQRDITMGPTPCDPASSVVTGRVERSVGSPISCSPALRDGPNGGLPAHPTADQPVKESSATGRHASRSS